MIKVLGTVLTAVALLVGCGEKPVEETQTAKEVVTPIDINMSLVFTQNELLTQELIKVTDKIRERTDGGVNIKVFPGGQLPVYKDNLEQVVNGADWIAVEDLSYLGDYVPD
ncbi:MAG: TRAP-type C4-dicarboxylate transport system substrate-binding protein, partial [Psychromonas sp.]